MQQVEERVVYSVARQGWLDGLAQAIQRAVNGLFAGSPAGRRVKDFLNGVWLAHPLHPTVTDVPVGAWTTSLMLDGVESVTGRNVQPATTTAIGVGIGGAVISAMSGVADWSSTHNDQRRVGLIHAALNSVALTLYGVSLWRRLSGRPSGAKRLSTLGWLSMVAGAYLGGELTYRLGTQVDRNAWVKGPMDFTPAMPDAELLPDRPTRRVVNGIPVMLVRRNGVVFAMSDICSHEGCSLSEGRIENGAIVCPCHGSTYRLEDGSVIHGPSPYAQPQYQVRVHNGQIEIRTAQR